MRDALFITAGFIGGAAIGSGAIALIAPLGPAHGPFSAAMAVVCLGGLVGGVGGGWFAVRLVRKAAGSDPDYDDRPEPGGRS